MPTIAELETFAKTEFGVDLDTLILAIELSPNAQGYLDGAVTELVLKGFLEKQGYELLRIKEKWEGDKLLAHHGDFYIRKNGTKDWFVLESKGVKSNSEKWHRIFNRPNLISFISKYIPKTPFKSVEKLEQYVDQQLPKFKNEYKSNVYTLNEIKKHKMTGRNTEKSKSIAELRVLPQEKLDAVIETRLDYVMQKIRLLETHLVSGGSKKSERTQATPRVDEFHILALDLFLKTREHQFIFVNPKDLEPSSKDKNHLQQNYLIGFVFKGIQEKPVIVDPWSSDFNKVFSKLTNPVNESDMQVDRRGTVL